MCKAITKNALREKRDFRIFPFFRVYAEKLRFIWKNRVFCIKNVFGVKTIVVSVFFVVFVNILLF